MREVVERRYKRIRENMSPAKDETAVLKRHDFGRVPMDLRSSKSLPAGAVENSPGQAKRSPGKPESKSISPVGATELPRVVFDRGAKLPNLTAALAPEGKPTNGKEPATMPSLILIDGGLGQLHAAADALESLGFTAQPLASIAKKEEVIYVYGNEEEPIVLDRRSPVLHLVQLIRDESHRFAIGYHRQRRSIRDRGSELLNIPGVGPQTRQRLLTHFGSLRDVQQATAESLSAVVPRRTAETIWRHFHQAQTANWGISTN
jgi:excinuclease ABC subunit C